MPVVRPAWPAPTVWPLTITSRMCALSTLNPTTSKWPSPIDQMSTSTAVCHAWPHQLQPPHSQDPRQVGRPLWRHNANVMATQNTWMIIQPLLQANKRENNKSLHYWPFVRGMTGPLRVKLRNLWERNPIRDTPPPPSNRSSNAESVSCSWRHHD